jgi:hypothetical protein
MVIRELKGSDIDREGHRAFLIDEARKAKEAFLGHMEVILAVFRDTYPPHVIATIACWGLSQPVGPDMVSTKGLIEGIEQHHIELLQALLLTLERWEWGSEPASNQQIQAAIDAVKALATAFHRRRMIQLEEPGDDLDRLVNTGLQERMRDHTQMVRNWGYYDDMIRIVRGLHAPLDAAFAAYHGYSASDLVDIADALVDLHQERLGGRFVLLKDIFRGHTRKEIVHGFFARYEGVEGDPDAFLASLPKRMPLRHLRTLLLSHADRWLVMEMRVEPGVIAERLGKPLALVARVFAALGLCPGALRDHEKEHLFLSNPVWTKPVVQVDDDFLFFAPQSLVSFLPSILRNLFAEAGITKALEKRRTAYLEEEMASVIGEVLPSATLLTNVEWYWEGVRYETDLIVVIDRVVLIAEAKSGALTPSGLRGAPDSVRKHVRSLIVEPAIQSARLRAILLAAKDGAGDALALANRLGLDPSKIDTIIRVSVTLDDFSTLASAQADLKRAGLVPDDVDLPPTMGLADLFTCANILDDPLYFLHYLAKRERFQGRLPIFGDELDYIGTYLVCGLELPEIEAGTHKGMFSGMSQAIDRYYVGRGIGRGGPKPRPAVEPYVAAVLARLRTRATPSWTTMGLALLDAIPPGSEEFVEEALEELAEQVSEIGPDPDRPGALIASGACGNAVAVFHVFPKALDEGVLERMVLLADEAMEELDTRRCVAFARMLERWDLPYAYAASIRVPAELSATAS